MSKGRRGATAHQPSTVTPAQRRAAAMTGGGFVAPRQRQRRAAQGRVPSPVGQMAGDAGKATTTGSPICIGNSTIAGLSIDCGAPVLSTTTLVPIGTRS